MKKFAKILGFLGFFVTVATAQIGTAWAAGAVRCLSGYYLPAGSAECQVCPGTVPVNGTNVGVYCPGSDEQEWIPNEETAQGLRYCNDDKACGGTSNWEYTDEMAKSSADCNGGPDLCSCHYPNNFCPEGVLCQYDRSVNVSGTNFCNQCQIDTTNQDTWCPLICPKSCDNGTCTCPNDDCTGYDEVNNLPGVHYCGTAANACDVTHLIQGENTSNAQIVEANPLNYQCSALGECKVECSHEGNPTCDYPGATCEWDLNTPVKTGYQQGDDCIDPQTNQPIGPFDCDIIVTGCANPCEYWDENQKLCVSYTTDVTYKCGNMTQQGPTVTCGTDYFVNRTPNAINGNYVINLESSGCVPAGQVFSDWKLSIDNSPHSDDDRFTWNYTNSTATFEAEWEEDKLYIHYHRYGGNWVQANPPAEDKEAFTISDLQPNGLTKYWTLTRDNSTFRGWCDDLYYSHLSNTTWMNEHCQGPSSYTIPTGVTQDVHLYAWWECADGYSLGSDYQCAANGIDVIYTCTSPDGNHNTINRSFSNDATVGVTYTIRSVGTDESDHQVNCSFPGYYLENNYRWKRMGSNPEELYEPGLMDSPWAYTSTQTFELSGDYWKPNTYRVLYNCGNIDGTPVSGSDTADIAIYGQPYYVATNIYNSFINNCSELNGYVVDYWTFEDQTTPRYNTGEQFNNPNGWNLAADDHYFVAHWVQTGGTLTLDPNGGSASNPATLYTTQGTGVYLDPTRTQQMSTNSNGLTTNPSKSASVQIYPNGTGANFQWNGSTITYPAYVDDDITLDFTGFYNDNDGEGNIKLCIGTNKFITSDGINIGKNYNISEPHTWYAHWDSKQVYLPVPTRAEYDFLGWYDDPTNGNWVSDGDEYYEVSGDVELYAHWGIACRSVSFNENGGTSTGGGNNNKFWKISGQIGWYSDSACTSGITPNVGSSRPTKENATFIGYDDTVSAPTVRIFDNLGAVTANGLSWTITQNATLYAQYECDDLYHFNPQTGNCEMCDAGQFYDPGTNSCKTCADILGSNWTSKEGYTWSIDQCYRNCGTDGNDNVDGCEAVTTPSGHGFEQFVAINGGTGRQISFYGNERQNIYTCRSATGATKCPLGLLASNNPSVGPQKPMAAAVTFNNIADGETAQRYIIGNRAGGDFLTLADGFAWSQVVGAGQQGPEITNTIGGSSETYHYTFITYPADTAPAAISREHQTFAGYVYPEDGTLDGLSTTPPTSTGFAGSDLTETNANNIIQFAKNLEPANNNMSPDTRSQYSRNLWPIYTDDPTYTLTYLCNGGETPSTDHQVTGLYVGTQFNLITPDWCTGCYEFTGWWDGSQIITPEQFTNFTWNYNSNMTFIAQCAESTDKFIIYNKIPVSNVNASDTTENGNTYVPANGGTPTTFTCGDGTATNITGQPQLKNSDDVVIGTVVAWCDDNGLNSGCVLPKYLQNTVCTDKNVYAKWECKDEDGYHLNESKDDCVPCPDDTVWNGSACVPANTFCPEGYPHTRSPYNWDINNCFKYCDKSCADIDIDGTYIFDATNMKQIAFYGNERNGETSVCDIDDAKYCPRVLEPRAESFRPKESLVTFKKMGNNGNAGTRYIVGNTHSASNGYFNDSSKWWSYIVGAGQKNPLVYGGYTLVIYPTDMAPNPGDTGAQFKGYYDAQTGGTQRVAAELGLDSSNAIAFPQSSLSLNQIGDRILYPQYCENGQEWNGSACIGTDYTVKYICGAHGADGDGMSMENTATYGQSYKVAYNTNQMIAQCRANEGYVLKTNASNMPEWKLNNTNGDPYTGYTGETIPTWNFTAFDPANTPTFTAQYDCATGYTANGDVNDGGNCVLGVFTVTYDCGIGTGGSAPDSGHPVSTNDTYNVLPNGIANGGVVNCNLDGQGFAGWKFSGNENTYNGDDQISPWIYGNETMTATYRPCDSTEVLVNGVCYPTCSDTTCTEPTPQNSQSHCPTDHTPPYPNNVTCSYAGEDISGYLDDGVCRYANGDSQGQPINIGVCQEIVVCNDSAYVWNPDPDVWECVPNTGITYNVQFKCNATDAAPIPGYSFNVTYSQSITIPSNSACQKPGHSYSQWKATQYSNPATLEAQNSTRTIDWNYTHNETFIADWNDGNVYHVNLHAYSCDDSTQTGTFGSSGVQNLWEKYNVAWYRTYENGVLSNSLDALTAQQLPTRSGWTFGGYNNLAGDARVRNIGGIWSVSPATLIQNDEDWCAIWSQCNPNEYWNNGVCVTCNTATNGDFPLGDANATSIYQCYRQCSICTRVCPQTEGVDYCEYGNNPNMNGNLYYPGTGTCQPNYEQNCPITVLHCLPGYTPNGNNTACVPNSWTVNYYCGDSNAHSGSASGMTMWNTATYGQDYKVAYDTQNTNTQIADCNVRDGYILNNWKLNNSVGSTYPTGWSFRWLYEFTSTTPTFTAQYICDTDNGYHQINSTCQQCPENSYWTGSQCKPCDPGYHVNDAGNGCTANTINLVYGTSCGTSNPSSATCTFNSGFNLATHSTSTGYAFNGWMTPGTNNGPHAAGSSIQCTAEYLGNAVYTNNATVTITGSCASNNEQCPAQLPTNANLNINYPLNPTPNAGTCTYHLQCASCIGSNDHDCYTRDGMNSDGTFTVTGPVGNSTVLNNVRCEPATYTAVYKCGTGTPGGSYTDNVTITYNGSYTVLPNGSDGVVTCSKDGEMFNHWAFNLESGGQYIGGESINPWRYHGSTVPTFTAQYGQCPEGEVPVDGECKPMCTKNCIYPGANPGACPSNYPTNAICAYDPSSNPVIGYSPSLYSNKCLDVDYPHDPVVANQCDVTEVTCPIHYEWNPVTLKCDPKIYQVRLDANGGTTSFGFVSKLFEKYSEGWGKNETGSFIPNLQLSSSELPTGADISQIFTGYGINCNSTARMISADGTVLASPTTLVDNDRTWYACYGPNTDATFTIKFRCTANGQDIYVQNVHVGENINVPATGVCPGVAFNQWKSTLNQPIITLPADAISVQWNHYFDEVFIPDTKAVYRVDLNANGGIFPSDDYKQLWYAVDMGWYKDEPLTQRISNSTMPSSYLPTNQGSSFNGWFTDPISGEQRGNMISSGWRLPSSISTDEEWWAHWGQCELGQFWSGGECKSCSEATYGEYPLSDAGATSVTQCYKLCSICLNGGCPTIHGANCVYNSNDPSVQNNGKNYNNGIDTCVPNSTPAPNCPYMITDCNEPGWIPAQDGQSCVEDEKHTITLDAHIIHGVGSDPDVLYTWHNRGVYLYSNYTGEMTTSQNPINDNPLNYAIVTFNLNGQGASLVWNGRTYTGTMDANVLFYYQGFWKSVNGSSRYIDIDGHITENGRAAGMAATDDLTWHARWQPRALGTVSQSGNDLPQPTRPGYTFDGWYDLPMGGNQVYSSSLVNNDMTVYARWSDEIYTVNLVSDGNNCQPSNNTPTKLYEKYNVGWNRYTTGTFDQNLTLAGDELPTPNAGYEFKGYYDALSGGDRVIRPDGRVEQEPNYTDNNHTWYARCGRPTGPFTITFRCGAGEDPLPNYTQSVQNGGTVRVPPKSMCPNAGRSFTTWMGDHNTTFTARDTEYTATWSDVYANEDFTPNWNNGNVYYVTLAQTDATEPGIEILYEKYDNGWGYTANGLFNVTRLSGSQLPRRSGYVFAGYKYNDVQMGYVSNGQWGLPDPTVLTDNNQVWEPDWSQCAQGEYWDGYKCYPCPDGFTDNPHAIGIEQCYGNCQYDCQESGCPSLLPVGMQSCAPNHSGYPQWGIKYNRPGATCLPQGQQSLPICPNDIICNNGYDLVGTECRDNRYTITLDSDLYNDNGTPANPSTLYTWFNHGVYRDYNRTLMMTPNENPLAVGTPSTFATVTLNGNGAYFNWHNQYGPQLQDNIDFVFDGFYDTTGAAIDPVIGIDRHITEAGQSIGTTAQNNQTWRASWRNGSVDLPSISRDGYTFDGWWTECNGGTRVSMGDQTIAISGDITLCAHWSGKSYTITYNCDSEGGQGGAATDSQLAYQNTTYTVRENFIPCSKPATETTRAYEFENWKFNLNSNTYWPGDSIMWIFNADNPTFNAHYKECPNGWYFDGSCKQCPDGYTSSDIDADSATKCYNNCSVQCTESCPQLGEPGVIGCIYPTPRPTTEGQEYYGSTCNAVAENCEVIGVYCQNGYVPTSDGLHCQEDEDNYHEITLDPNGGTVGQEKLYTIYNTGVYLDSARTRQMSAYNNYLTNLPQKNAVATFDCNPECSTPVSPVSVELVFNGYYERQSGGAKYINKFVDDGVAKGAITSDGNTAGKGYTANATWFAQWSGAAIGNSRWPTNPTRPNACATYSFVDWYTEANGGNVVSPDTPVSEDVTWYAHWCESCPTGTIDHGSCSANNCVATFTCNDGYYWNADNCSCVLSPDTRFTLTYKPNGGTPTQPRTQSLAYGETFTTLGGDTFTKSGEVLCHWDEENHASSNTFPEAVAELSTEYTYLNEENITLLAHWAPCQCTQNAAEVQGCSFSVVNNACVPTVTCMPGYIPNGTPTCAGECNATCDTSTSCRICSAGTYQDGNECIQCPDGFTSNAGATSCYGNTISIDWDENGGNAIPNGSCVYGETFTLANAPSHSNSAMQFLGWKLANGDIRLAGASVMCDFTHVGVYSGTTYEIQAQWNECQCNYPLKPHVAWCQAWFADGECKYMNGCDAGYEPDPLTVYTPAAVCNPKNYNITYNCGDGIGIPESLTDSATFDANYTVKGRGTCQMTGFNFVGWKLSANNQTYQPGYRFEPWNFTQQNPTFTAQYTNIQCASDEILIGNDCVKCNCTIGTGATSTSCGMLSTNSNTCEWTHPVTCQTGFVTPAWSCTGTGNTNCTASCSVCPENQVEVGGSCVDCECTPDTTTGAVSCGTRSVSNNMCNWGPAICTPGHHNPNITCSGSSNQSCEATCGTCPANTYGPDGLECIQCPDGYTSPAGSTSIEDCYNNPTPYTITYRPNGGVNPQTGNNQPVLQPVTYWDDFTTLMGTTFVKSNHILTRWDLVGDDTSTFDKHQDPDTNQYYAKLNEYYEHYNTLGDTVLDAHWEQCTCTLGTGAESCGTLSTAGNACNWTNPVCQNGYVLPNMQCSGTGNTNCTLTCGECAEGEIIVDGQCVPCTCTTGTGAASCTPGATANNTCTAVGQCLVGYGNENGNANIDCNGGTNCVVSYNKCDDGWVSNENCQCNECPANTYQSGNTCVPCQNGYTSPAGSSSADACVPGAHTIHYLSNNGMNQTYDQSVTYGQSFMTEGGTRFTKTDHIMTHWNVESGASSTFTNGTATLSGNYVYNDTTDTTLSAQWAQCTCDADNCTTYATNSNTCACNATCPTGYTYGGCECDGTNCAPICTLSQSNAIYECGTGTGIPPVSELVDYGTQYIIKANAAVYGCHRDNSRFAGWEFDGTQEPYWPGDTVTWNYTEDRRFRAVYCNECLTGDHCTLDIPNPGECVVTCHTGYEWDANLKKCVAKTYENGITYKPNGGTPNQNYTQSVTYDAPFTTLGVVYSKARHILNRWDVESGGVGTFDNGYADLGREYIYKTDGATSLLAEWIECGINEISSDNQCKQCQCTDNNAGVTSCETSATNNDTCSCSGECAAGYINAGCNCNGTTCTQSCSKCADNQVSVNNVCENCECEKNIDGIEGIISGCVFASNNGNTCNWDPTTCRLGYGYPDLTCTETEHNNNCTASCTICPAGTYGDNGVECKPCPEGKTSLAGATSIRECFIDPNSCAPDEHIEHGECVSNTRACSIPDATSAVRIWNPAIGTYGPCTVVECDTANGYHESGNACVRDTCVVAHGSAESEYSGGQWECFVTKCDPGYEPSSDYKSCVECANRYVDGDIAVSGYIYECEIAACMYQGQKYALQNGECVPICTADRFTREDPSNPTGTIQWDERTKKCVRTCNPGYKMW